MVLNERPLRDDSNAAKNFGLRLIFKVRGQGQKKKHIYAMESQEMCPSGRQDA